MVLFGAFFSVRLANDGVGPPDDGIIDLSGLNVALVCSEDHSVEPAQRYSLWSLAAEAATLYQDQSHPNQIIIGESGNIYVLDEDETSDDGVGIELFQETGPLPPASQEFPVSSEKRLHEVWWQIATIPPEGGHNVTLKVIDHDNPTNFSQAIITQTDTKMRVQIGMKAKQFRLRWEVTPKADFDIVNVGCAFQVVEGPYAAITRTQ